MKCISAWVILGIMSCACAGAEVHVSAEAAGKGDGSLAKPFQTLGQARDAIRAMRRAGTIKSDESMTVVLENGVYRQQGSFELTDADGGSVKAPVVYRARENGKAQIQGGVALEAASFKPVLDSAVLARLDAAVRNKVRVCDLSALGLDEFPEFKTAFHGVPSAPWLYVNHRPMTLARWPNAGTADGGWAGFSKAVDTGLPQPDAADPALHKLHPGSFIFDDPRPARWNLAEGVWLLGYWTHDWADEVIRVAAYDPEKKVISLAAPHSYGINAGTWGADKRRFFAMNALEELDAPGEWYLDRPRKRLYFYPEADLAKAQIVLATSTQPLMKLNGAKHVKLVGLDLEYSHGDGIVAQNIEGVEIVGCTVANLAGSAISLNGVANSVRSCDVYNLGRSGISLSGGDRKTLTPAKNLAENNHIHHFGLFHRTYAPGIGLNGCGQIARNNRIHDAPHNAFLYGGNEHLLELNEVYRVVMETGDAGAFYTGRDWTCQGNILRHNYIHDLGGGDAKHVNTMGMYFDDCVCGNTVTGNVFYRAGRAIMIGGGRDNPILNNLIIDCPIGLHLDARGMTWKQWNDPADKSWCLEEKARQFNYTQPPWSTRYPRLAAIMDEEPRKPLGDAIRGNVFVDCTNQVCDFDGNVKKMLDQLEIEDNLAVSAAGAAKAVSFKGFANLAGEAGKPIDLHFDAAHAQGDWPHWRAWLKKEAPGCADIPFEKIGIYKDQYRVALPSH